MHHPSSLDGAWEASLCVERGGLCLRLAGQARLSVGNPSLKTNYISIPKLALPGSRYCVLLYYEYINGVLGKESHSLPIDYNYVIRASETI